LLLGYYKPVFDSVIFLQILRLFLFMFGYNKFVFYRIAICIRFFVEYHSSSVWMCILYLWFGSSMSIFGVSIWFPWSISEICNMISYHLKTPNSNNFVH
jgi:uncharacterized membrane protein